jgi:hypothetical protein
LVEFINFGFGRVPFVLQPLGVGLQLALMLPCRMQLSTKLHRALALRLEITFQPSGTLALRLKITFQSSGTLA